MEARMYRHSGGLSGLVVGAAVAALSMSGLAACGVSGSSPVTSPAYPGKGGSVASASAPRSSAGIALDPAYFSPGAVGITESGHAIDEAAETLPVVLDTMTILRAAGFRVVVSRTGPTTVLRLRPVDESGHILSVRGSHDDVAARDVCANMAHANVLVGVYFNAGASTADAGCITAYDTARPFAAASRGLARLVQSDVLAAMNARGWQIPDIGAQTDEGLGSSLSAADQAYHHLLLLGPAKPGYFTTPSTMPGALVEPLFITDPFEGTIAASSRGQHVIAAGLADAIKQYLAAGP
jgi:N-acetylmuramoyl-L-alanine amidase